MLYFHLFFMKFSLGFFLLKDFLLAFTADGKNKNRNFVAGKQDDPVLPN